ncbi:FG-GAP-like repeat-containing protein [Isosphaeraceae bacterium EP7]
MSTLRRPSRALRPSLAPNFEPLEPRQLLASALLRDISQIPTAGEFASTFAYQGSIYFTASDNTGPLPVLYRTDGTTGVTTMVGEFGLPSNSVEFDGSLYFVSQDRFLDPRRLWKITGTADPVRITDFSPFSPHIYRYIPPQLTVAGDLLYFVANDASGGIQIYRTDGTDAGTKVLKVPVPGSSSYVTNLTAVGNSLYFATNDFETSSRGLWKTDGTPEGTVHVADMPGGPILFDSYSAFARTWTSIGDTLYFTDRIDNGPTEVPGFGLFKSDGTAAGTVLVKSYTPPGRPDLTWSTSYSPIVAFQGSIYFADGGNDTYGLWKSDGTAAGTVRLKSVLPADSDSQRPPTSEFVEFNGELFFNADTPYGVQLWKTDGTAAGTVPVTTGDDVPQHPRFLTVVGTTLYFAANSITAGNEVWKTDGTAAGTVVLKDVNPGLHDAFNLLYPGYQGASGPLFTSSGNTLYFVANDGVHGASLYKSDGTDPGTVLVKSLKGGTNSTSLEIWDDSAVELGGYTYFVVKVYDDPAGPNTVLYRTDGTAPGTTRVTSQVSPYPRLTAFKGKIYFAANEATHGTELWVTDGTEAGTHIVQDIVPGPNSAQADQLEAGGDWLYFVAYDPNVGKQLYKTDGTTAGTTVVKLIRSEKSYFSDSSGSSVSNLSYVNGTLYFSANDGTHGAEPWKTDGTEAGTVMVADVNPGPGSSNPSEFQASGNSVVFNASGLDEVPQHWSTDGTSAGTLRISPRPIPAFSSFRNQTAMLGGTLYYFVTPEGSSGVQLWKTDGTAAGTGRVANLTETDTDRGKTIIAFRGAIYVAISNVGLFKSDGTEAGTGRLTSVIPKSQVNNTSAVPFVIAGHFLYFSAGDDAHGLELWRTDGTPEGTMLAEDIIPGKLSSSAIPLAAIGSRLLVAASDGIHGNEPWVVGDTSPAPRAPNDFDGDGKSDIGVYMPDSAQWVVRNSSGIDASATVWGNTAGSTTILSGDFDGDGKADLVTYDLTSAIWSIRPSSGVSPFSVVWGRAGSGDVPVVADFDGDGKDDLAVYSPDTAQWSIRSASGASSYVIVWGLAGNPDQQPVAADYDGDGKADLAVFEHATGLWTIRNSGGAQASVINCGFFRPDEIPVMADYDGDGKADPAVYIPATAQWIIAESAGANLPVVVWGQTSTDIPLTGDYDGDGKADFAVYRPSTAQWFIRNSSDLSATVVVWGRAGSGDIPLIRRTADGNDAITSRPAASARQASPAAQSVAPPALTVPAASASPPIITARAVPNSAASRARLLGATPRRTPPPAEAPLTMAAPDSAPPGKARRFNAWNHHH